MRAKTSYRITGAESGRTSTSVVKPPNSRNQYGVAFQTIAKHEDVTLDVHIEQDIRSMYVADKGYSFLEWDYAQAEDRVVRVLAKDWKGLENYNRTNFIKNKYGIKDDNHTLSAMACYNKDFEDITDFERQVGKKTVHAANYAMGKHQGMLNFAKYGVFLSEYKVGQLLDNIHRARPEIRQIFHKDIQDCLAANNCILYSPVICSPLNTYPINGRKRIFFNRWGDEMFKEAYAQIPQSTVSDSNKFSMYRIRQILPKIEFEIVLEGHDSGLALVKHGLEKEAKIIIKKEAEKPINFKKCSLSRDFDLIIPVDFKIGDRWSELEKF